MRPVRALAAIWPAAAVNRLTAGPLWAATSAPPLRTVVDRQQPAATDHVIDVRDLLASRSVEELAVAADNYFRANLDNPDYFLAKPFTNVDETPDRLVCFAELIDGLRPLPGMRILDFGAGTGWSSRYLTQLGYEVICSDVSSTALELAKELFARLPVIGPRPAPTFQVFDGRRLDLPDASVDRVHCFDAFHHVPNPAEVLAELGRVLKPGGIAGFCEPGPNHSRTAQSQFEMRNYTIIENDVVMADIWPWAQAAASPRWSCRSSIPSRSECPWATSTTSSKAAPPPGASSTTSARSLASGASSSSPKASRASATRATATGSPAPSRFTLTRPRLARAHQSRDGAGPPTADRTCGCPRMPPMARSRSGCTCTTALVGCSTATTPASPLTGATASALATRSRPPLPSPPRFLGPTGWSSTWSVRWCAGSRSTAAARSPRKSPSPGSG